MKVNSSYHTEPNYVTKKKGTSQWVAGLDGWRVHALYLFDSTQPEFH